MRCALLHCSGSLIWRRKNLTILSELSNLCTCSSSISCIFFALASPTKVPSSLPRTGGSVKLLSWKTGVGQVISTVVIISIFVLALLTLLTPKQVLVRLRSKVVVSDLHFFRLISRVIVINSFPFLGAKNKTIHLIICRLVGIIVIVTLFLFFTSTFGTFLFL